METNNTTSREDRYKENLLQDFNLSKKGEKLLEQYRKIIRNSLLDELLSEVEARLSVTKKVEEKHHKEFIEVHDQWFKYNNRSKEIEDKLKMFESGLSQGNTGHRQGKIEALNDLIAIINNKKQV